MNQKDHDIGLEMVALEAWKAMAKSMYEINRVYLAYNNGTGIESGFIDIKVTSGDVGKTYLEMISEILHPSMLPKIAHFQRHSLLEASKGWQDR